MSRRSRTTLVLQVRLPLPPGKTQAEALEDLRRALREHDALTGYSTAEFISTLIKRETVYL